MDISTRVTWRHLSLLLLALALGFLVFTELSFVLLTQYDHLNPDHKGPFPPVILKELRRKPGKIAGKSKQTNDAMVIELEKRLDREELKRNFNYKARGSKKINRDEKNANNMALERHAQTTARIKRKQETKTEVKNKHSNQQKSLGKQGKKNKRPKANLERKRKRTKELVRENTKQKRSVLILFYTPFFGELPWRFLLSPQPPCPYQSTITFDKNKFDDSDVVVFHAVDTPGNNQITGLAKRKPRKQRWLIFVIESPPHTHIPMWFNGIFDWTITYSRKSEIFAPYGVYKRRSEELREVRNYAKGKDKLIYWPVSNCGHIREDVTKKLMRYVPVDVYGACKGRFPRNNQALQCRKWTKGCSKLMRTYKFRLAFENSFCYDYVTEKYWDGLEHDNVPIVLGGANYDSKVAIPGSYINVLDFPTIKDLADYIKYLDKNNTAYNEYHTWKKKYEIGGATTFQCRSATAYATINKTKVYDKLTSFWGTAENCGMNYDKAKRLVDKKW